MKFIILSFLVIICGSALANSVTTCDQDEYASNRIKEILEDRSNKLDLTNKNNQIVGAMFLDETGEPSDMILCGTYTNYYYVDLKIADMIPSMYEYKQIATVESASIYQDEALMSAFAYTDDDMLTEDDMLKIKINFQSVNLADMDVEVGEFYITVNY